MPSIISDNRDLERSIERIVALLESAGAEFNDQVVLKCVDRNLSVEAPPDTAGQVLVRLPWHCLVPVEPFRLSIENDDIVISSCDDGVTSSCIALMEAMLELYNFAKKVPTHRQISPWSVISSHAQLLQLLKQGRRHDEFAVFEKLISSDNQNKLTLRLFLSSRTYNYNEAEEATPFPVLMPVIDFFNHHFMGSLYDLDYTCNEDVSLAMRRSRSVARSGNECFACYGPYDGFDTWINYSFIDEDVPVLRSVAMTIDLPGLGTIRLADFFKRRGGPLPESVKDLSLYIPRVLARRRNHLEIASLLLPGPQAPEALRRTIFFLITELNSGRPGLHELVLLAEEQILAANTIYYKNLLGLLRTLLLENPVQRPILDNFIRMCDLQTTRIKNYSGYAKG